MATQKEIKQKILSTKSINKITQAMQLVSTAKSQRAIKELKEYKSYYLEMKSIISTISSVLEKKEKKYEGTYWIIFTSDLGLAGGYNTFILKLAREYIKENDKLLIIGMKGKSLIKNKGLVMANDEIFKNYDNFYKIIMNIISDCKESNLKLKAIYTEYISQLTYQPKIFSLIPADYDEKAKTIKYMEFEPDPEELLDELEALYVQIILRGIYKETKASENTSRRVAMENATNNSKEMLKDLKIKFNRTRQAKITQEISEIIGGAEAQK